MQKLQKLVHEVREGVKGLSNLILSNDFHVLAISSFKLLYKHAKCHRNGVKIAIFRRKITTIAHRLPPDPHKAQTNFSYRFKPSLPTLSEILIKRLVNPNDFALIKVTWFVIRPPFCDNTEKNNVLKAKNTFL